MCLLTGFGIGGGRRMSVDIFAGFGMGRARRLADGSVSNRHDS